MIDSWSVPKQWLRNPEITEFVKLLKKTELPDKF